MDRRMAQAALFGNRALALGIVLSGACLALSAIAGGAHHNHAEITCTNPVSGTSWQIRVDYRRSTVNSNPAEISRDRISWFDPKDGGHYVLDRASGDLTAGVASSTGGYFRHARCTAEKQR
jgi:hypothetical protein